VLELPHHNFDVLVISETKLDATFPDAIFRVDGFRFIRRDRDIYGGGIIIYSRSDLTFEHVRNLPLLSGVEALLVKLRINKSWLMVVGVYRPPKFKFNMWKDQLYNLFEYATSACENILVLGDLNCDIFHPSNNGGEGRHLLDMGEIFNLDCLINEPTRLTTTSQTLIDVLLINYKRRFLASGTLEPHMSDYRLVFTVMKASHKTQEIHDDY